MTKDEIKLRGSTITASSPTFPQSCCLLCIHVKRIFNHLSLLQNVCLSLSRGYGCCSFFPQFLLFLWYFHRAFFWFLSSLSGKHRFCTKVKGQGQWSAISASPFLTWSIRIKNNRIFKVKGQDLHTDQGHFLIVNTGALFIYYLFGANIDLDWRNELIRYLRVKNHGPLLSQKGQVWWCFNYLSCVRHAECWGWVGFNLPHQCHKSTWQRCRVI